LRYKKLNEKRQTGRPHFLVSATLLRFSRWLHDSHRFLVIRATIFDDSSVRCTGDKHTHSDECMKPYKVIARGFRKFTAARILENAPQRKPMPKE